jgi:ADP-ribose pyrophosphatase YjhB (NUDIX family)
MIKEKTMITAAGAIFLSKKTKRVLLNFRSQHVSKGSTFGFWGGKLFDKEDILEGLSREIKEEIGFIPHYDKFYPLDVYCSPDGHFQYYSFVIIVDKEFIPKINSESDGYIWCNLNKFPKQLHSGAKIILENPSYISNILKLVED